VDDANFGEDIEIGKLEWFFSIAERISLGRFREVLSTRVFIEDLQASSRQQCGSMCWAEHTSIRGATTRP
jgi:hypothetical protein